MAHVIVPARCFDRADSPGPAGVHRPAHDGRISPLSHDMHVPSPSARAAEQLRLRDRWGRVARDLRVSLTDRCNLRCTYCMPVEGLTWLPREQTLTDGEIDRLVAIAVGRLGVREVRFTGGEPLLRRGLEAIVAATARLRTDEGRKPDIALTTAALGLDKRARSLAAAGLDRVNISLDSASRGTYHGLTHRDRFDDVVAGIDAARDAGLRPIKINAVVMRGVNDADVPALLDFCLDRGLELRLIEHMPLGQMNGWSPRTMVAGREIRQALAREHTLTPARDADPSSPAMMWDVAPSAHRPGGRVGIIASMTEPFCATCDRTRITADGRMRPCLFGDDEVDLREGLRNGLDDAALARLWAAGMARKKRAHGSDQEGYAPPNRRMNAIGG